MRNKQPSSSACCRRQNLVVGGVLALAALTVTYSVRFLPFSRRPGRALTLSLRQGAVSGDVEESILAAAGAGACTPLEGLPSDLPAGVRLLECSGLHPTCENTAASVRSPANIYDKKYVIRDTPRSFNLRLLTSEDEHEVIARHVITSGSVVCPDEIMRAMEKSASEGKKEVFLDIGSNIGSCAVVGLTFGHTVVAFEPGLENLQLWRANVLLNAARYPAGATVYLLPYALADKVVEAGQALVIDPRNSGNAMVVDPAAASASGKKLDKDGSTSGLQITCVISINSLVPGAAAVSQEGRLSAAAAASATDASSAAALAGSTVPRDLASALRSATMGKIDVQGHEIKVLKGMRAYFDTLKAVVAASGPAAGAAAAAADGKGAGKGEPQPSIRFMHVELTPEVAFRKGDDPQSMYQLFDSVGYGLSVSRDTRWAKADFMRAADPATHNHDQSSFVEMKVLRLDLMRPE